MHTGTPCKLDNVQMDGPHDVVEKVKKIWGGKVSLYSTGASQPRLMVEKREVIGPKVSSGQFKFVATPIGHRVVGWEAGGEHCFIEPDPARRDQNFKFLDMATGLELVVLLSPQP